MSYYIDQTSEDLPQNARTTHAQYAHNKVQDEQFVLVSFNEKVIVPIDLHQHDYKYIHASGRLGLTAFEYHIYVYRGAAFPHFDVSM
ncbi:hypothetical protein AC578_306 [Pseudocercospora eumusae]|uniref:Uncharacterized protein n=1 Tax=Pseudocercospora eumusae TaxID=321146 RepID=A0A139HU22_9PEZI|nr:hypothetical protein AC578_306 [Pseudocercospora eumusae]